MASSDTSRLVVLVCTVAAVVLCLVVHGGDAAHVRSSPSSPAGSSKSGVRYDRHFKSKSGAFLLDWTVDSNANNITMRMSAKAEGWIGIMWNNKNRLPHQEMDTIYGAVLPDGTAFLIDGWSPFYYKRPRRDPTGPSDVTLLSATEEDGWTTIEFRRPLDTGSKYDAAVVDRLVFIGWAVHATDDGKIGYLPVHTQTGWTWLNFHGPQPSNFGAGTFSLFVVAGCFLLWLAIRWMYVAYKYCYYTTHTDELSVHANAMLPADVEGVAAEKKPQVNTSWSPLGPAPLPPFSYALPKTQRSSCANALHSFAYSRMPYMGQAFRVDFAVFCVYAALNILFVFVFKLPSWQSTAQLGSLAIANALLCFVSVTRNSILVYGLGVPFDRAVVFHRWLGTFVVGAAVAHGVWYANRWFFGEGSHLVTINSVDSLHNTLGFLAAVCFVLVFITSRPYFRRKYFEVFYYSHYLVIPAMVFAALHHWKSVPYVAVAAALYGIDRIFRLVWGLSPMKTTTFEPLPGGAVRIRFPKHPWRTYHTGQYVWVNFPSLSYVHWHPFTLSSSPCMDECEITVRDSGGYTSELVKRAQSGEDVYIRVDGPYGKLSVNHRRFPAVVLVSGGVGVTPMISVLREIYALGNTRVTVESASASEGGGRVVIKGGGGSSPQPADTPMAEIPSDHTDSYSSEHSYATQESYSSSSSSSVSLVSMPGSRDQRLVGDPPANPHTKVVYFVWAVRSEEVYEWFAADIEEALRRSYFPQFPRLVPIIHVTQADSVSSRLLSTGRPDVDGVLERVANDSTDVGRVGVLACGPGPMVESTWLSCMDRTQGGMRFSFHHETFEL